MSDPKFIEVADDRRGLCHYLNVADIVSVSPRGGGRLTVINVRGQQEYPFFVVESPEQVMEKINAALEPKESLT